MSPAVDDPGGRRAPRGRVDALVPVVNAMTQRALGFTRDISRGGLKLKVAEPLVDQAVYQVRMELQAGDRRFPLEGGVQVVRQQREADGSCSVGLRFIHLDAASRTQLDAWLEATDVDATLQG